MDVVIHCGRLVIFEGINLWRIGFCRGNRRIGIVPLKTRKWTGTETRMNEKKNGRNDRTYFHWIILSMFEASMVQCHLRWRKHQSTKRNKRWRTSLCGFTRKGIWTVMMTIRSSKGRKRFAIILRWWCPIEIKYSFIFRNSQFKLVLNRCCLSSIFESIIFLRIGSYSIQSTIFILFRKWSMILLLSFIRW